MYDSKMQSPATDDLFKAILTLETLEDCYRFFDDICTISEIQALTQRFAVARLLDQGETYSVIAQKTGASTATVSRVNKCLVYGADGYRNALAKLETNPEDK